MSIKTVLFDLDGTLLPMDQEAFINDYFGRLAKKLVPYGYDPKKLIEAVWTGTKAMVKNTGMKVFLLTDCLINKAGEDISQYPHGSFTQLDAYLKELFL